MLSYLLLALLCLNLLLLVALWLRKPAAPDLSVLETHLAGLGEDQRRADSLAREETGRLREELQRRLDALQQAFLTRQDEVRRDSLAQLEVFRVSLEQKLRDSQLALENAFGTLRNELSLASQGARAETRQLFSELQAGLLNALGENRKLQAEQLTDFQQVMRNTLGDNRREQGNQLVDFSQRLSLLQTGVGEQLERSRLALDARLAELQTQNAAKLEEMRQTVDQRLQQTLEKRLGDSFKLVGDNLERVIRSLGEMQQMAASVGDLKRVLTNVKTRGSWGEVQLGNLLAQTLTVEQFAANVAPKPDSREVVEFAIRLPGATPGGPPVWLPIDAKFPTEDYDRLLLASEKADAEAVASATKALGNRVWDQARSVAEKYLAPPHTTDFGLLFLPTEGLYAEVLRQPGLASEIQQKFRVVLTGPTTLTALLNSLQMGFRTLAIEQRASDVWQVLGAVKTEFGKFGETLEKVQKRLEAASKEIETTSVRTRVINRKLREVESLPADSTAKLLPLETNPDSGEAEPS